MPRNVLLLTTCLLLLLLSWSCSKEPKQEEMEYEPGPVDPITGIHAATFEWQQAGGPPLSFFYEPDDSLAAKAVLLRDRLIAVYEQTAAALGLDTLIPIDFYCYKSEAEFKKYTSRPAPFYLGDKFYYGYGPPYGRMFTIFIMEHLPGDITHFNFFKEGLPALYDWSGRNYHQAAYKFLEDGTLDDVKTITDNESYDSLYELKRQVEAASLIGFMMYTYGTKPVMEIYHSQDSFAKALKDVLGVDEATLQKGWREFLPEHTTEKERERMGE